MNLMLPFFVAANISFLYGFILLLFFSHVSKFRVCIGKARKSLVENIGLLSPFENLSVLPKLLGKYCLV